MIRSAKITATFAFIILLSIAACSPQLISEKNLTENDFVLVEATPDYRMTFPEFYNRIYNSELLASGGIFNSEQLQPILDSLVLDTLMGLKATTLNLLDYPDAFRRYNIRYVDLMIRTYFEQHVNAQISFDSSDVIEHYFGDTARYYIDEQVMAYNLLIKESGLLEGPDSLYYKPMSPEQLKEEARLYMDSVLSLMGEGKSFQSLVEEFSHDDFTARQRGEMGWVKRGKYRHPFDSIVFSLKNGEVCRPYYDSEGWHAIMVEDHLFEGIPEMTDEIFRFAAGNLMNELIVRRRGVVSDSVQRAEKQLIYNDEVLSQSPRSVPGETWCAVLNGQDTIRVFDLQTQEQKYQKRTGRPSQDVATRKEFVQALATSYSVVQEARRLGFEKLPWVDSMLTLWHHEYGRNLVRAQQYEKSWMPSDSMIRSYYNNHIELYQSKTPLKVQRLVMEDSLMADYVRGLAEGGADFMDLVAEHYNAPAEDRQKLADLGWIGPDYADSVVYRTANVTAVGRHSNLVPVENGFMIVKLVDRFQDKSVDQARTRIGNILKQEHANEVYREFRDRMFQEFSVTQHKKLDNIHIPPLDFRELE
ncbi:MAG: peptidylprolyl isomerase [bacterium]|nr:peptidylprolyl isomerase [bacterium]